MESGVVDAKTNVGDRPVTLVSEKSNNRVVAAELRRLVLTLGGVVIDCVGNLGVV